MSIPSTHSACLGALSARGERACAALIEERWRRAPGISLRLSLNAAGVVERPGRTRFDLQWNAGEQQFQGGLRCGGDALPLADGALQLVIIESLGVLGLNFLVPLMTEAMRLLAEDGRLMIVDTNPWSWLGLRGRWQGVAAAPTASSIVQCLQRLGLEDIESEHVLRLPPCPRALLERHGDRIDALCTRLLAVPGCVYAVSGRKRSSNVIAIPVRRDRRQGLVAAPEGMRRAS